MYKKLRYRIFGMKGETFLIAKVPWEILYLIGNLYEQDGISRQQNEPIRPTFRAKL